MKIAISGKMCAGKSFITNALMKYFNNNIKKKISTKFLLLMMFIILLEICLE